MGPKLDIGTGSATIILDTVSSGPWYETIHGLNILINIGFLGVDIKNFYQLYQMRKSWKSISNGIFAGTLVWRLVQDHINPNLLFLGTEYGVYVSLNQGGEWHKFSNGMPTISVRDLAIQKRENDLVAATFGRSFYVLE